MASSKHYELTHEGQAAIICGSAPCLLDEFDEAWYNLPHAKIIAVNESVSAVRADFICSYHAEKFSVFKSKSLNKEVKTVTGKGFRSEEEDRNIDYRFDNVTLGATSCGDAVQIATKMGFSEIVMVGAPMDGGTGYFNKTTMFEDGCHRFGSDGYADGILMNHKVLASLVKDLPNVRSMSGFTREIFGGPEWQTQT